MSFSASDTPVDRFGEAGLIERLYAQLPAVPPMTVGPGDDGAVAQIDGRLVMTTDSIVENIDFILGISSPEDVGRKLAIQNLADVSAMGARPQYLLYTALTPKTTAIGVFDEIAYGIGIEAQKYGAAVVGGDLGTARDITLSLAAVGVLEEGVAPVVRSGAQVGDLVVLGTPVIGMSAAGLAQVLARASSTLPNLSHVAQIAERCLDWHRAPGTDLSLGYRFGRYLTSMLDVSDGLVRDGRRIAEASGVLLNLDSGVLAHDADLLAPLAAAFQEDEWDWVLGSGEEHAMLATVDPRVWERESELRENFRAIGEVEPQAEKGEVDPRSGVLLDGEVVKMRGFDHFESA